MICPAQRRAIARRVQRKLKLSERRVCRAIDQPRSTQRYVAQQRNGERRLVTRMNALALRHPRFGYRRIAALLWHDGWQVNVKRIRRLWRKEGLKVTQKQHKRRRLYEGSGVNACHRRRAETINDVWTLDFCHDRTAEDRNMRILSVIDEYTRRCLGIKAERTITGAEVVKMLKALMKVYGTPAHLRCDNGPELISSAVKAWLGRASVGVLYVTPGSPWENGYVESYHARLRDEVLQREEFATLAHARVILQQWQAEYNTHRPHSALGYQTPEAFAAQCQAGEEQNQASRVEPGSAALRPARHEEEEELMESVAH